MQVKEIMTNRVDVVAPDMSITAAARKMRDDDVGALPIAEGDRLVGMVTDRDMVIRAIAAGKDPGSTSVRDVMSQQVLYCFEDQTTDEAASSMGQNQIRRLPVLSRDKRLVGIVSLGDVAQRGPTAKAGEALESISAEPR